MFGPTRFNGAEDPLGVNDQHLCGDPPVPCLIPISFWDMFSQAAKNKLKELNRRSIAARGRQSGKSAHGPVWIVVIVLLVVLLIIASFLMARSRSKALKEIAVKESEPQDLGA
ncbi:hypothetical protein BU23DRAFT_563844 [Bimuria novae-zelandiae CBS 107.79]|uniref:Uncharacterized protein n=1 Tax=Bimuria novae-zelandiae CBS 107.79 TaxID=1447943 RepID=A0A6A5VPX2_9PLEO|nr:hypothetical protein BU23DRAFT_563844 [Bimuria novae-zelandiae CBS 107.79]